MHNKFHALKCTHTFFEDLMTEKKNFELRKNDRNYQIGDKLVLQETYKCLCFPLYTGRYIFREITYILKNFEGLKDSYCILGLIKTKDIPDSIAESLKGLRWQKNYAIVAVDEHS